MTQQNILITKQNNMITEFLLRGFLSIMGLLLFIKSTILLRNFYKERKTMYHLTRTQVKRTAMTFIIFGLIYAILNIAAFVNVQLNPTHSIAEVVQYANEVVLLTALIYVMFRVRKRK